MYLPIDPQPSCASAWLHATRAVNQRHGHEGQNVIIDVVDPLIVTDDDKIITSLVDHYLRDSGKYPVATVANTIFPQSIFARHGSPAFYEVYKNKILPRIAKDGWGRYFDRMISFPLQKKGTYLNPLEDIVEKMKKQNSGPKCFRNVYELTVYDPIRDAGPLMNRQCLSFLSFKLTEAPARQLLLTAMYRNHYYIQRLLGNLIGLGHLMRFVAGEVGVEVGSLTVVSTHADVDCPSSRREDVNKLLEDAARVGA